MSYRPGNGANRRKLARLAVEMSVELKVTSGLFSRGRACAAQALDYNRYGMALRCPLGLRPHTRVTMDISAGHMVLRKVRAEVVSSVREGRQYRIGLRFYRKLSEFTEVGPGHPLHFLLGLEESLELPG